MINKITAMSFYMPPACVIYENKKNKLHGVAKVT